MKTTPVKDEWDDKTGETKAVVPENEVFSFFADDEFEEGQSAYSGTILLHGQKIRVRELDAAERAEIEADEVRLNELMESIATAQSGADVQAISAQIEKAQTAVFDKAIAAAVSGWELKRPNGKIVECTAENKKKLRLSQKAELYDKIVQRSSIGRDLAGFLAAS